MFTGVFVFCNTEDLQSTSTRTLPELELGPGPEPILELRLRLGPVPAPEPEPLLKLGSEPGLVSSASCP